MYIKKYSQLNGLMILERLYKVHVLNVSLIFGEGYLYS